MKIFGFIFLFFFQFTFCQTVDDNNKRYVKPIVISFTNFHKSFDVDSSAFQQEKLILGVNFQLNENWSGRLWVDVIRYDDKQNPDRLTPYIKPGCLSYHKDKLTVDAGVLLATQFSDQLTRWGNRYIYKTFQDKYFFCWSNDFGIRGKYQVAPDFEIEAGVLNGAGYRNVGISLPLKFTGALFYSPTDRLYLKVYSDVYRKNVPQSALATFIDYRKSDKYSFSLEYNYKWNYQFIPGHDRYGISAYSTIHLFEYVALVSRLDRLYLKYDTGEGNILNSPINDTLYLLGLQFQPLKQIRMAVDYQLWRYYDNMKGEEPWLYVHLEYRLM